MGERRSRALAMGLAVLSLLATGCGASQRLRAGAGGVSAKLGRLAGYVWTGRVRSVSAAWTVPTITSGPRVAYASTWVAAQAPGPGPAHRASFVQVGLLENRSLPAGASHLTNVYDAFWSATALSFHPLPLFAVRPGDRVSASLELSEGRWHVAITDLTNDRHARFATTDDAKGPFILAEWLQEDPTASDGGPEPYSRVAPVHFAGLTVDGSPPSYADVSSQWMSANGEDFAPAPLTADRFVVAPATLSATAQRYLADVAPADRAQQRLALVASRWRPTTPHRTIRAEVLALAAEFARYDRQLSDAGWPQSVRPAIRVLGARTAAIVNVLRAAGGRADERVWRARYSAVTLASSRQGHRVRRLLHAPESGTAAANFSSS